MDIKLSDLTLRFLEQMQKLNITGYQLKKDGIIRNEATVTKIKQGLQQPSRKTLDKFCEVYKVNRVWLLTGESSNPVNDVNTPVKSYISGVPYYNVDFIGGFDLILNDQTINPEYYIDFKQYNSADCWCNVTGHSMEPEINQGDIIALKELHDWRTYIPAGEIYGLVTTEHRTIKKVCPSPKEGYLRLIPTNKSPEYIPQDIPISIIIKVYKVLGCMKRL